MNWYDWLGIATLALTGGALCVVPQLGLSDVRSRQKRKA